MTQPRNPLDLIVISRARLQEVIDDAVERGRMTRGDAADLVAELLALGRAPLDAARRVAGLGPEFPIAGYDDLTAAEVAAELDGMSDAELRQVRSYEKANANRKTVLGAIERKLA
jgi:putative alpha-1,2-mannosidase